MGVIPAARTDQKPMPNIFAYIVLFSYPIIVVVLFRRLPLPQALVWSVMGGYLFLPEGTEVDLPLLPSFDKVLIPSLTAALMCWLTPPPVQPRRATAESLRTGGRAASPAGRRGGGVAAVAELRRSRIADLCLLTLLVLTPVGIALTNSDPVIAGPRFIGGIRVYDIFSMMLNSGVMLLPFLLARRHLGTPEAHLEILRAFVILGLVYSVLILIEVRLSPQLHRWFYGFHAHFFGQQIRGGGFRPMVFIQHGLRVGLFMLLVVLAAMTLYKLRGALQARGAGLRDGSQAPGEAAAPGFRTVPLVLVAYLLGILLISKALGAFLIAVIFLPVMLLTQARSWRFLAAFFAVAVLLYPMARSAGLTPVDRMYEIAQSINEDRARSFKFRLDNEDMLLARASEKPLLGWGGWGRSRVYEAGTGRDIAVTDGTWVIVFGVSGWIGYLAQFGLLTLPVFAYLFTRGRLRRDVVSQGLCLMLTANMIDLIPNSGLTPVTWMMAGALLGRFERRGAEAAPEAAASARRSPASSRAGSHAPAARETGSRGVA